jgi:hypothetical protein
LLVEESRPSNLSSTASVHSSPHPTCSLLHPTPRRQISRYALLATCIQLRVFPTILTQVRQCNHHAFSALAPPQSLVILRSADISSTCRPTHSLRGAVVLRRMAFNFHETFISIVRIAVLPCMFFLMKPKILEALVDSRIVICEIKLS